MLSCCVHKCCINKSFTAPENINAGNILIYTLIYYLTYIDLVVYKCMKRPVDPFESDCSCSPVLFFDGSNSFIYIRITDCAFNQPISSCHLLSFVSR